MPLYQPRVTVLCGFTYFIIGPFFFEKSMEELLKPFLAKALSEITFMKDRGPPHISRGAKQLLKDTFGENRLISRHFIYQWPPRSPDLTPCDFCLWGYIKSCVYRCWPTTLAMLKASIRWHAVIENEGCHIEQDLEIHLILLRREDLKCTFCGSGITTEMLHYLFDCAALSDERRKLNDKAGQLCPSFPALIYCV
ncbi:hypothetical protein LAZ67_4003095 [Cordylochernes scorpioides]|uniref:Reverse transcriptase zinc-binding domain-containing protein n=1 Tax=Cordylochernes scorpioides TaxID=51811 RepID=A0ABY6KDF6_9ARAC|nr:hypothetical protein LAZ67_4003095 [Cordylochernes scorpioides]